MNFKTIAFGAVAALGFSLGDAQAQSVQPDSFLNAPKNGFVLTGIHQKPNLQDKSGLFPLQIISYRTPDNSKHATFAGIDTNNDKILSQDEISNTAYSFFDNFRRRGFGITVGNKAFYYLINQNGDVVKNAADNTEDPQVKSKLIQNIKDAVFGTPPKLETDHDLNPFRF